MIGCAALRLFLLAGLLLIGIAVEAHTDKFGEQLLSKINVHRISVALSSSASVNASPAVLGLNGEDTQRVTVDIRYPQAAPDDWIGVFSPANFNSSLCPPAEDPKEQSPYICTAPIKDMFANQSNSEYTKTGQASLKPILINQQADFSFALFSGGLSSVHLHGQLGGVILVSFTQVSYRTSGLTQSTHIGWLIGSFIWSKTYSLRSSPYPEQDS